MEKRKVHPVKATCVLLLILLLLAPAAAFAVQPAFEGDSDEVISSMLVDAETGEVLYEKNTGERVYPGSTTKIMTALLLLEEKGIEGEVTAGTEVNRFNENSTLMGLIQNETVSVKDLLYGLMLPSGNDAAATIAAYVSGSEDAFCELMNKRARELGMENTNFVNSCGLFLYYDESNPMPEEKLGMNHYTTAADMAKLAVEAYRWPEIREVVSTASYTLAATNMHAEPREVTNYNSLVYAQEGSIMEQYLYTDATGMKTGLIQHISIDGTIYKSYGSLVASAEKGDGALIALAFGDHSAETETAPAAHKRWETATGLLEYGFSLLEAQQEAEATQAVATVSPEPQETAGGGADASSNDEREEETAPWWLWVLIPAAVAGGLFIVRAVNLSRRRRRRKSYRRR